MAPERALAMDVHGGRDAAVLVPVFPQGGDLHAVFTRRRHDLRRHAGEISFPGGRQDEGDADFAATALREAEEEIGLDREIGALLVVDWVPVLGPWTDALAFLFDGGILDGEELTLDPTEVRTAQFLTLTEATPHLRPSMTRRLALAQQALTTGHPSYADFGRDS